MEPITAVIGGLSSLAFASASVLISRIAYRRALQESEEQQQIKVVVRPWNLSRMNTLYFCHHDNCQKYHRTYQQDIACMEDWVAKEVDLNNLFHSSKIRPICPHCRREEKVSRSNDTWLFLESHPHCLLLDEQGAEQIYDLLTELRKTIKENEEVAAYQAYNGFVQREIQTVDLSKKVDSITADKITVGVYREFFDIDGNYNIPRELELKTMPDDDEEDLLNHVRQVHDSMRKMGINIDDYCEKPKGYDTGKVRGMFHSLDEENAHRVALGKEPRFPEPVEKPKRDFAQVRAEFEECQEEVNAFHDVNRFKVNYTKEEIAFHQAEYKELYERFEALREEMWNYQGKPKSMTELTEEIRRLETKAAENMKWLRYPDTPLQTVRKITVENKAIYAQLDKLRNERMTAR